MAAALYSPKLSESKYSNWIKAGLAVLFTKEGIEPFVYDEIDHFRNSSLADICNNNGLPVGTTCSDCCTENVVFCPTNRICNGGRRKCSFHRNSATQYLPLGCPNKICHNLKTDIQRAHRYYGPSYKNTDATQWCSNTWEVAKCFMPPDGYNAVRSVAETDFNGINSVIINYKDFQAKVRDDLSKKGNIFEKGRDIGKAVRHSPTLEVEDTDLQQYFTDLHNLLSDPAYLAANTKAQKARKKLSQLHNDTLIIGIDEVRKVLDDVANAVKDKIRTEKDEHRKEAEKQKLGLIETTNKSVSAIEGQEKVSISELDKALKSAIDEIEKVKMKSVKRIEEETGKGLKNLAIEGKIASERVKEGFQKLKTVSDVGVKSIAAETDKAVKQIQSSSDGQIQTIETVADDGVKQIASETDSAVKQIQSSSDGHIKTIETVADDGVKQIASETDTAVIQIQSSFDGQIKTIEMVADDGVKQIASETDTAVKQIQSSSHGQIKKMEAVVDAGVKKIALETDQTILRFQEQLTTANKESEDDKYNQLKKVTEELFTPHDVDLYFKAIKEGKERDKLVRVMVVGHKAQGKTSLTKRLFGQSVECVERTNGIEVHRKRCFEDGSHWKGIPSVEHVDDMTSRLVNVATQLLSTGKQDSDDITDIADSSGPAEDSTEPLAEEDSAISLDFKENNAITLYSRIESAITFDSKEVCAITFDYKKDNAIPLKSKNDGAVSLDSKYDKDMVTIFAKKLNANTTLDTAIMEQDNAVDINVWDFGGQFVFYATHQIFLSKSAIYLLVFNLKESFDSMLIDDDFPNHKYTLKSCLKFWMESIHSFVGSDDGKEPMVILVGTHKGDCCGKESEQLKAAMDIIYETKTIHHIYQTQFATECMDPRDESFEHLRNIIYKLGLEKTQHTMIPAKWILLEQKVLEIRNRKIVRLVDILKIDSENSHPIQDEEQVKLFLKYHHEKGSLIFFDEEKLHEFIVLDPQFLIDAFKCIITSRCFYRWNPKLKELGDKLMTSGILELKLLEDIWGNDETNQFCVFQDVLLAFMERLRILAEMKDVTETAGDEHVQRCFLVPSLLKGQADESVIKEFFSPCKKKSNISLVFGLEKSSILPLVYQRVIAAVLAKWPPVYFPKSDPLLYRDIGVFRLNYQHAGLVAVSSVGLEIAVANLCLTSPEDVVCDKLRRYIEKVVLSEFGKFSSGSEKDIYKYYLRCNHSDHGHKGSLNMHELKQVMRDHKVHCPDHGNHVVNMRESVDQWFKKDTLLSDDTIPDRELTDKDLSKIAQAIGKNWKLLGIDLGLGLDDIEQCEIDNKASGVKTTIYYILKEWRKRYPEQNSLKVIIKKMNECEGLTVNWDKINNLIDNF